MKIFVRYDSCLFPRPLKCNIPDQVSILLITNFLNTLFLSIYLYTTLVINFTNIEYLAKANWCEWYSFFFCYVS